MSQIVFVDEFGVSKKYLKKATKLSKKLLGLRHLEIKTSGDAGQVLGLLLEEVFSSLYAFGETPQERAAFYRYFRESDPEGTPAGDSNVGYLALPKKIVRLFNMLIHISGNSVMFLSDIGIHVEGPLKKHDRSPQDWSFQQPRYTMSRLLSRPSLLKKLSRGERAWLADMGDRHWASEIDGEQHLKLWDLVGNV